MTTAAKKRTDYMIDLGNNKVVSVKALATSIGAIVSLLGYDEEPVDGIPSTKTLVGTGQEQALLNGCFPIAIYYRKNKKTQRAVVLVSPTKADTIAQDLKGKNYANFPIIKVTPVRRRKYTFY